nr:hypothetical protein CFP56_78788 [Quercus suber]
MFKSRHVVKVFLMQVLTSLFADRDDLRLKGAPPAFLIIYVDVSSGLGSLNTIRIIRRNQPIFLIIYVDVSSGLGSLNTIRIIRRNQPICNTLQVSKLPRAIGSSEI